MNRHAKELKELKVGQSVKVQNQAGNYGKRWARTGTVVEVGPGPRQYAVRMDGSRNVTLRNRKFLRTFNGVADMMADDTPKPMAWEDNECHSTSKNLPGPGERVRQKGVDDGRDQAVQGGAAREVTQQAQEADGAVVGEDVREVTQQAQEADGAVVGERTRYPRRERRVPVRYKDFETGEGE